MWVQLRQLGATASTAASSRRGPARSCAAADDSCLDYATERRYSLGLTPVRGETRSKRRRVQPQLVGDFLDAAPRVTQQRTGALRGAPMGMVWRFSPVVCLNLRVKVDY